MEEVLNNLIHIDDECKKVLNELREKQENIEFFVNKELIARKENMSSQFKDKIDLKKSEYEMKLSEKREQLEIMKQQQMEDLKMKYNNEKIAIINSFFKSILEEK